MSTHRRVVAADLAELRDEAAAIRVRVAAVVGLEREAALDAEATAARVLRRITDRAELACIGN